MEQGHSVLGRGLCWGAFGEGGKNEKQSGQEGMADCAEVVGVKEAD